MSGPNPPRMGFPAVRRLLFLGAQQLLLFPITAASKITQSILNSDVVFVLLVLLPAGRSNWITLKSAEERFEGREGS